MLKILFACFSLALLVPVGVRAQTNESSFACPKIAVPSDATIIGIDFSGGDAMADIYIDDPNAPLSVVDVEIEPGDGRIFVVARTSNAAVWRFTGAIGRVAGGLFIGDRSLATRRLTSSAVVGLEPEIVTILPPKTCPLRAVANKGGGSMFREQQQLFAEMSGREMDVNLDIRFSSISKITLPSGLVARNDGISYFRYPGAFSPELAPEAAKLWLGFLRPFPGGLVDINPDHIISLHAAKEYERLPGVLGLAQLVSDGTLELTGTPDGLSDWWGELGDDWVDIDLADRLRRAPRTSAIMEDKKWMRTTLASWTNYASLNEDPEANLHGNRFRLEGNNVTIEDPQGNWVPLKTIEFIIRGPFTVPPATPGFLLLPLFLLPSGVPEPVGPFRRDLPLLREAVD